MNDRIWARVAEAVTAETLTRDATGRVRVTPPDTAGIAAAMALASREGWRVRVEGRGGWSILTARRTSWSAPRRWTGWSGSPPVT